MNVYMSTKANKVRFHLKWLQLLEVSSAVGIVDRH